MSRASVGEDQSGISGAHSPIFRGNRHNPTRPVFTSSTVHAEPPQRRGADLFVAAGSQQFLSGLMTKLTFASETGVEGECCRDPPVLFVALELRSPAVIVVDCELFHQLGHRILSDIRSRCAQACLVLVFDRHWNFPESEILSNDVRGCLPADRPPEFYFNAFRSIHAGELWLPKALMQRIIQTLSQQLGIRHPASSNGSSAPPVRPALTSRESEIGDLVLDGLTNKEIGHRLNISEDTVKKHLKNVFAKCGIHRRSQMASVRINQRIGSKPPRE
jgi:DNA-binding NarL/FixJ family response regulator